MKKLLAVGVLAVVGLLSYNFATTGKVTLIPEIMQSQEEQELAELERRFGDTRRRLNQAGRTSGLTGMDMTSDAGASLKELDRIDAQLEDLRKRSTDESVNARIDQLRNEIRATKNR